MQESSPGRIVVRRPLWVAAFERHPGCGPTCSAIYGHDPVLHEAYGQRAAAAELGRRPSGIVSTGPLVLDFDARTVSVSGRMVGITPLECEVLFYLARHLGHARSHREVVEAVWGVSTADLWAIPVRHKNGRWHGVRQTIVRLRGRLGPAGSLVETVKAYGYRLRAVGTSGDEEEP